MKYAQFQAPQCEWSTPGVYSEELAPYVSGLSRISEWVEVTFPARAREDIVVDQIRAIDNQIRSELLESAEKVKALETRKQELLAITNQGQTS